jgi:putative membrane protein
VSAPTTRPFFGQPFGWLVLSVALAMVPLGAALAQTGWTWTRMHPAVNAILNGTSAVFVIAGGIAIKRRAIDFHRRCMLAAVGCSAVFLVSYLIRFATTGAHRYPGTGAAKTVYLIILGTHTVLAAIALPLVLRALWLALTDRVDRHRRLARWAYPVWLYVGVTGVVVYLMLYHFA